MGSRLAGGCGRLGFSGDGQGSYAFLDWERGIDPTPLFCDIGGLNL